MDQTIQWYEERLQTARNSGNQQAISEALTELAIAHIEGEDLEPARGYLEEALPISTPRWQRRQYSLLGSLALADGDGKSALDYYQKAHTLSREFEDEEGLLEHLADVYSVATLTGNIEDAFESAHSVLESMRGLGSKLGQDRVMDMLIDMSVTTGDLNRAMRYAKQAVDAASDDRWYALMRLGSIEVDAEGFHKGYTTLKDALNLTRQSHDRDAELAVLTTIGSAAVHSGNEPQAVRHLRSALEIAEAQDDTERQIELLANLGVAHGALGNYEVALQDLEKMLGLSKKIGSAEAEIIALESLANLYIEQDKLSRAVEYFKQALAIAEMVDSGFDVADLHGSLGDTYSAQDDLKNALKHYQTAAELYAQLGEEMERAEVLVHIAEVHLDLENRAESRKAANEARIIYEQYGFDEMLEYIYELLRG